MYRFNSVDEKVYEHNFQSFVRNNPGIDVVRFDAKDVVDPFWNRIKDNGQLAWANCDLVIYDFYRQHPNYKNYVYMEWDAFCTMNMREMIKLAEPGKLACCRVRRPKVDDAAWFFDQWLPSLPPELQKIAVMVVPLCGVYANAEVLSKLSVRTPLHEQHIWCEMRMGVLARMNGFEPTAYPFCPQGLNHYPGIKSSAVFGAGLWHPMKQRFMFPTVPEPNCPAIGTWQAYHPHWTTVLKLNDDGSIESNELKRGWWHYFQDEELVLYWLDYPPEKLNLTSNGFANRNGFVLSKPPSAAVIARAPIVPGTFAGKFVGSHPHWTDLIELTEDHRILGADGGTWSRDHNTLLLNWTHYKPAEPLNILTNDRASDHGFVLERAPEFKQFRVKHTAALPFVIHGNGSETKQYNKWWALAKTKIGEFSITIPESVAVVTFNNTSQLLPLEQQLNQAKVSYTTLCKDRKVWEWRYKVNDLVPFLQTCKSEYVLALDTDVLFVGAGDLALIVADMKSRKCRLLFGAELNNYPSDMDSRELERSYSLAPFSWLNAGTMLGETKFVLELIEKHGLCPGPTAWRHTGYDQEYWKAVYAKEYPHIRIDDQCKCFLQLAFVANEHVELI